MTTTMATSNGNNSFNGSSAEPPSWAVPSELSSNGGGVASSGGGNATRQKSLPDSESGIEDSADSLESARGDGVGGGGGIVSPCTPLSPPIPIPSSPRRCSLQQPPASNQGSSLPPAKKHPSSAPSGAGNASQEGPSVATQTSCGFSPCSVGEADGTLTPTPGNSGGADDSSPSGLPTIEISEETGPGEQSAGESQPNNLSKNGGGDSETSEMGGPPKPHLPKTPSPAKLLPHHGPPHASSSQANDGIPTDMSDSTDTEPDSKVTCLGTGESVVCPNITTHHQGREIINTVYALPVDTVFTLLFTNSKFMLDLYTARKTSDVVASPWQSNPETNQKIRQVTYTLTLPPNNFGPKVSHVTETQVVSPFSKHGDIYTVDAEACNAGIPYADSFFVSNHWCLTRESATETRISVWSQVKYKKNVWGFMKGVIDKNAYCGVESLLNDINAALLAEVDLSNLKRTRRRRRRVGSKGEPPDVLLASTVDKVKDIHKATQIPQRKLTLPTVTPDNGMSSNEGPVRVVVATLVVLLTLNALLYYKLWALEEKVVLHGSPYPSFDPKLFRSGSFSGPLEEWIRILQHQEALHAAEVERWRKSIEEAAGFLRKAEESLRNLHTSIPPQHASKIQFLLRQIQNLHEAESQRRSSEGRETDSPPVVQKRSEGVEELTSDSVYRNSKVNEVNLEL